jgi:hypothetical protein
MKLKVSEYANAIKLKLQQEKSLNIKRLYETEKAQMALEACIKLRIRNLLFAWALCYLSVICSTPSVPTYIHFKLYRLLLYKHHRL